jgi:NitT/TauT family transport system permease protein
MRRSGRPSSARHFVGGLGYLLMTAIGLQNIQVIMSVTLLLVLVAATVNTLLLKQDRRLRQPGG